MYNEYVIVTLFIYPYYCNCANVVELILIIGQNKNLANGICDLISKNLEQSCIYGYSVSYIFVLIAVLSLVILQYEAFVSVLVFAFFRATLLGNSRYICMQSCRVKFTCWARNNSRPSAIFRPILAFG